MFALFLVIATLITGIFWCVEHFKSMLLARRSLPSSSRQRFRRAAVLTETPITVTLSHKSSWIKTCSSAFPVLLLVFIVRSFIFEPFQIPSGSMMPTLLIGDFIFVKKFAYGIKDPITQSTLIKTSHPKRGDVVVFKYPLDPRLDYIKRVVGLPGDRITYDPIAKRLTVQQGCISLRKCSTELLITYSDIVPSDFVQTFNCIGNGEVRSSFFQLPLNEQVDDGIRLAECKESLDGVVHNILTVPGQQNSLKVYYQQPGQLLAEWVVSPGNYFVMGDNRDNSADSRYWGFVPERNLMGKATVIWMSFEKLEGQWPTGLRLRRIGSIH